MKIQLLALSALGGVVLAVFGVEMPVSVWLTAPLVFVVAFIVASLWASRKKGVDANGRDTNSPGTH